MVDHLPTARQPVLGALEIPCICNKDDYDNLGFLTYPHRHGWPKTDSRIGWKSSSDDGRMQWPKTINQEEERDSFLQSWLFFGLLCETLGSCGVPVNSRDFVRWNSCRQQQLITTSKLPLYLDLWQKAIQKQPLDTQRQNHRNVAACLFEARNAIWRNLIQNKSRTLSDAIIFSLDVLVETLNGARIEIWDRPEHQQDPLPWAHIPMGLFSRFTSGYAAKQMERLGWCPSDIMMLHDLLSSCALYLATTISRPLMLKDHASCTENNCVARQVHDDSYLTAHFTHGCGCESLSTDPTKATRILEDGGFPLVALTQKMDNIEVEVIDANQSRPFVAISHVWADGLGNATENSLPQCQLLRLKSITGILLNSSTEDVTPKTHIWMDTLCVPLLGGGRKLALAAIKKPFQGAEIVLVLDKELQQASLETSRDEIAIRILCCGWMRRLWTLEEAIVADTKLVFLFKEGPLAWRDFAPKSLLGYMRQPLKQDYFQLLGNLLTLQPVIGQQTNMFTTLVRIITYRTTSRASDETICLASMMGLDGRSLPYVAPDKRMREFLLLARQVPRSILFTSEPLMSEEPGFRWAPPTFLGRTGFGIIGLRVDEEPAACEERGLMGTWPGFIIKRSDPVFTTAGLAEQFYLQDAKTGDWWWISVGSTVDTRVMSVKWRAVWRDFKEFSSVRPGIVMEVDPNGTRRAVLVRLESVEDGVGFAGYLYRLYAKQLAPEEVTAFEGPNYWLGIGEDGVPRNHIDVEEGHLALGDLKERKWCIT